MTVYELLKHQLYADVDSYLSGQQFDYLFWKTREVMENMTFTCDVNSLARIKKIDHAIWDYKPFSV